MESFRCDGSRVVGSSVENKTQESQKSLAEKMLDDSKENKNKYYKKLMKNLKNDPKLQNLVNYFQQNQDVKNLDKGKQQQSTKYRLRAKLEEKRLRRSGSKNYQVYQEKLAKRNKNIEEKSQLPKKTEEESTTDIHNIIQQKVSSSIQDAKKKEKNHKEKLKKLQKKYGQISFEKYSKALKKITQEYDLLKQDEINHEKNIIELYLKQNPQITENQLDVFNEDISDDNISDLEDLEQNR